MATELDAAMGLLQRCRGKSLTITKYELEIGSRAPYDSDKVNLHLDDVFLRDSEYADGDDYVADRGLVLLGSGSISTWTGDYPLPLDAYEIPLAGQSTFKETSSGLDIRTERAEYSIKCR